MKLLANETRLLRLVAERAMSAGATVAAASRPYRSIP
jgi:hypothetical protein